MPPEHAIAPGEDRVDADPNIHLALEVLEEPERYGRIVRRFGRPRTRRIGEQRLNRIPTGCAAVTASATRAAASAAAAAARATAAADSSACVTDASVAASVPCPRHRRIGGRVCAVSGGAESGGIVVERTAVKRTAVSPSSVPPPSVPPPSVRGLACHVRT